MEEFLQRQEFLWNYYYLVCSEGPEKCTEEKTFKNINIKREKAKSTLIGNIIAIQESKNKSIDTL